jgi:hypothetical protein
MPSFTAAMLSHDEVYEALAVAVVARLPPVAGGGVPVGRPPTCWSTQPRIDGRSP